MGKLIKGYTQLETLDMQTLLLLIDRWMQLIRENAGVTNISWELLESLARILDAGVDQSFLSTPEVFFPLLVVILRTASAFA